MTCCLCYILKPLYQQPLSLFASSAVLIQILRDPEIQSHSLGFIPACQQHC